MRKISSIVMAMIMILVSLSCGKDSKPTTRPEDEEFA